MIIVVNKYKHVKTDNDVFIGRGSPLGNPFTHRDIETTKALVKCNTREEAISKYEEYLREAIKNKHKSICDELNRLWLAAKDGDVNLVCFCKPKSCHGDIIKKVLEEKF